MLHRPRLIPDAMKTMGKNARYDQKMMQVSELSLDLLFSDEEIVIVEPTDPDEDRLRQQQQQQQQQQDKPECQQSACFVGKAGPGESDNACVQSNGIALVDSAVYSKTPSVSNDSVHCLLAALTIPNMLVTSKRTAVPNGARPSVLSDFFPTLYSQLSSVTSNPCPTNNHHLIGTGQSDLYPPYIDCKLSDLQSTTTSTVHPTTSTMNPPDNLNTILPTLLSTDPTTASVITNLLTSISRTTEKTSITVTNVNGSNHASLKALSDTSPTTVSKHLTLVTGSGDELRSKASGRTKRFSCPVSPCPLTFSNRFNLTEHIRTHTGERPFVCSVGTCTAAFKRHRSLRDHMRVHEHYGASFQDPKDQKLSRVQPKIPSVFPLGSGNLLTENPETQCLDTTEKSEDPGLYLPLRKTETTPPCVKESLDNGIGAISCVDCTDTTYHNEQKVGDSCALEREPLRPSCSTTRYPCPYDNCDRIFLKSNKMNEHARTHTGERPYSCPHPGCAAAFSRAYSVRRHMRGHVTGRRHPTRWTELSSDVIDQSTPDEGPQKFEHPTLSPSNFAQSVSETIDVHLKLPRSNKTTNTEKIDLFTAECSRPTIAPKSHRSLSTPHSTSLPNGPGIPRPHPCPFKDCTKTFAKMYQLRDHIWGHTGRRPFVCNQCTASFVRLYDLRRHEKIHLRLAAERRNSSAAR